MKYLLPILTLFLAIGCVGIKRDTLVRHPDAPALITQGKGWARVAVYDKQKNELVDVGWVQLQPGWTLVKYDWEKFIGEKRANGAK